MPGDAAGRRVHPAARRGRAGRHHHQAAGIGLVDRRRDHDAGREALLRFPEVQTVVSLYRPPGDRHRPDGRRADRQLHHADAARGMDDGARPRGADRGLCRRRSTARCPGCSSLHRSRSRCACSDLLAGVHVRRRRHALRRRPRRRCGEGASEVQAVARVPGRGRREGGADRRPPLPADHHRPRGGSPATASMPPTCSTWSRRWAAAPSARWSRAMPASTSAVRLRPEDRADPERIRDAPRSPTPTGRAVPLTAAGARRDGGRPGADQPREGPAPHHGGGQRARPRHRRLRRPRRRPRSQREVRLPPGYSLEWGGQFENLQEATARLTVVVPAALALIFVLLYVMFRACGWPR